MEFGVNYHPDMSDEDLNYLMYNCQQANKAMDKLEDGTLSIDDAIALCEMYGCNADDVLLNLTFKLDYLGLL